MKDRLISALLALQVCLSLLFTGVLWTKPQPLGWTYEKTRVTSVPDRMAEPLPEPRDTLRPMLVWARLGTNGYFGWDSNAFLQATLWRQATSLLSETLDGARPLQWAFVGPDAVAPGEYLLGLELPAPLNLRDWAQIWGTDRFREDAGPVDRVVLALTPPGAAFFFGPDRSYRVAGLPFSARQRLLGILQSIDLSQATRYRALGEAELRPAPAVMTPAPVLPGPGGISALGAPAQPVGAASGNPRPQGATPPGATPPGATPPGTTPPGATPPGATPAGTTPPGAAPAGATPAGATAVSSAALATGASRPSPVPVPARVASPDPSPALRAALQRLEPWVVVPALPELSVLLGAANSRDPHGLVPRFFPDVTVVREIAERDGATIFTDGQRALRLYPGGELEFRAPAESAKPAAALARNRSPSAADLLVAVRTAQEFTVRRTQWPAGAVLAQYEWDTSDQFRMYFSLRSGILQWPVGRPPLEVHLAGDRVSYLFQVPEVEQSQAFGRAPVLPEVAMQLASVVSPQGGDIRWVRYGHVVGLRTGGAASNPAWSVGFSRRPPILLDARTGRILP